MSQPSQQQPESVWVKPKDAFTLVLVFANIHAACLHPFLRRGQGVDVPGMFGVIALLLMAVVAESAKSYAMVDYILLWIVALIIMRFSSDRSQHSRYTGYPWWLMKLPPVRWVRNQEASAKALEPLVCLVIGAIISQWTELVGGFVGLGVVSLTVIEGVSRLMDRRTEIEITNAMVMGERMAGRR